jgi:hypothetical protein
VNSHFFTTGNHRFLRHINIGVFLIFFLKNPPKSIRKGNPRKIDPNETQYAILQPIQYVILYHQPIEILDGLKYIDSS